MPLELYHEIEDRKGFEPLIRLLQSRALPLGDLSIVAPSGFEPTISSVKERRAANYTTGQFSKSYISSSLIILLDSRRLK